MCGIAGFLVQPGLDSDALDVLRTMTTAIRHRGPDDTGEWLDAPAGIALGHRRLAVIDLSPAGHQPMVSASGRYVVVYNGEIYNHRDLRADLEKLKGAPVWRGHSDTEALLAAIDHWGVEETLGRLNGMFAFALWDRQDRALILARDRLGEKPIYYGRVGQVLLFGSELKSLKAHPAFKSEVDRDAVALFLRYKYIPSPHSIWRGISKLPPAHYLVIKNDVADVPAPICYWDFRRVAQAGMDLPLDNAPNLADELQALLQDAVALRMEADVPLGAFLSGGIDSSTIVALMQARSSRPVRTFSIGFGERNFNEALHAKAVATHLGTQHTELYVSPADAFDVIPKLPAIWDEPFSDPSQLPTYLVSEMTRQHVTVSLSGDGGDELFGGYRRYLSAAARWRMISAMPAALRRGLASLMRASPVITVGRLVDHLLQGKLRHAGLADRLPAVADLLDKQTTGEAFYQHIVSHWKAPCEVALAASEPGTVFSQRAADFDDIRQLMMYLDTLTYLPDDILVKVDRASMAVSLEARVPFLDHRVVEYAWRIPMSAKIRGGVGKRILREVLHRHVPADLVERPKMGFGVPIDRWLCGPLRDWAEELLDERRLGQEGFFDPGPIRDRWRQHLSGQGRWHYYLWDVLMFQAWWSDQRTDRVADEREASGRAKATA